MKIGVDMSSATTDKAGIGYYTSELLKALVVLDKKNTYYLFTHDKSGITEFYSFPNVKIIELKQKRPNIIWIIRVIVQLKFKHFNILISPSIFSFPLMFGSTYQFVHDIIPITNPEFWNQKEAKAFKNQLMKALKRSKKIITTSDYVKDELTKYYPVTRSKTYSIGGGLHKWVMESLSKTEISKVDLPKEYILSIGTLQPRKNYITSIKAFAELKKDESFKDLKYVIAGGRGWNYEEIFETVRNLKLENEVVFLGYVKEENLVTLHKNAKLFLYLSFNEGYALPVMQSYVLGLRTLASDIPVLKEIMGDKIEYVSPSDISEIVTKLKNLLKSKEGIKIDKDFLDKHSWDNVANEFLKLYSS